MDNEKQKEQRVPPQNIEAEKSVLAAVLIDSETLYDIADLLSPSDFYRKDHGTIYEAMMSLFNKSQPVDVITVTEYIKLSGNIQEVGGMQYIASLADEVPFAANAKQYAEIVAEKSLQRKMIQAAKEIATDAYEPPKGDVKATLESAEKKIFDISQRRTKSYVRLGEVASNVYMSFNELIQHKGVTGIPTGFKYIDEKLAGLHEADLILIAARPGMGKTALMLNIAQNVAIRNNYPVAVFNLEMSKEQLATRMFASEADVDNSKLRTGDIGDADWSKLAKALGKMTDAPIYFDDSTDVTISSIRAKCRKLKMEKDIKLIVIDYLQLMQSGGRSDNRVTEVSDISRALKVMARELNIPVIVGSQLSREVEKRSDKRPVLSDLRESGAIEQDADIVIFLYREDYYKQDTSMPGIAEVIIAKHRNGPTGTIKLSYDGPKLTFHSTVEKGK